MTQFSLQPVCFLSPQCSVSVKITCSILTAFQDPAFRRRVERFSDTVVALESFVGSDKETNPVFKDYHGNG